MTERLAAPESIGELIQKAEERGRRMERVDIGWELSRLDLRGFSYDPSFQSEVLRLRDEMCQAVLKGRK